MHPHRNSQAGYAREATEFTVAVTNTDVGVLTQQTAYVGRGSETVPYGSRRENPNRRKHAVSAISYVLDVRTQNTPLGACGRRQAKARLLVWFGVVLSSIDSVYNGEYYFSHDMYGAFLRKSTEMYYAFAYSYTTRVVYAWKNIDIQIANSQSGAKPQ